MSNAIFPTFPGRTSTVVKTPIWSTRIQKSVSGKEIRMADRARPIWEFALQFEVLRASNGFTEYQELMSFYNLRRGSFDSFLLLDPTDNAVVGQPFGTGDGVTTKFALTHSINGWSEPVGHAPSPTVFVAGVSTALFTNDGLGNVTFNTAPTAGQALTWTGTFYYRVRFKKDEMDFDQFWKDFWQLKKCEFLGVI